jgi:hypothetical protein
LVVFNAEVVGQVPIMADLAVSPRLLLAANALPELGIYRDSLASSQLSHTMLEELELILQYLNWADYVTSEMS